jgi:orotidine-5'-phosphate decarboxylase
MEFKKIRELANENFILVPGVGAQGGSLQAILKANKGRNIIINVARDIIFASQEKNFLEKVIERAQFYRDKLRYENYAR